MEAAKVRVVLTRAADRSYDVIIRDGLLAGPAKAVGPLIGSGPLFVVTDSNVAGLYGRRLLSALAGLNRKVSLIRFPAGEGSKHIRTALSVADRMNRLGGDRQSTVLALGGGVVGDLAGFVASIYKRGIGYIQIPTTLLAQVDSSIGGKTGIDAPWGKNQLGTFHHPLGVLTDPRSLKTLPSRELLNGVAELVKCAVVADRIMFDRLSDSERLDAVPSGLIVRACEIKAKVVSMDEKESNYRAILNHGHTVGHALEAASGYRTSHGAGVTMGMMAECWIAQRMGILAEKEFARISELLLRLSLSFGDIALHASTADMLKFARSDKKSDTGSIRMSLPEKVGTMFTGEDDRYLVPVSEAMFERSITYLRGALPAARISASS